MNTCMKNHEFMPDILVSPIFSQLSKREEKKIIQRCSNLVIQQMQVLFLFVFKPKVHALPNNKRIDSFFIKILYES